MSSLLLVDKSREKSLSELEFHLAINNRLASLVNAADMPQLIFTGPSGSGKTTRIRALLAGLYGPNSLKLKVDEKIFQTPSGRKIEVSLFCSSYHIELNPSEVGIYDRVVVQEVIKEFAQSQQLDKSRHSFKVVVIHDADKLSRDAQQGLRRTMEKYSSNLRAILCCTSSSRIIDPIKSRCLVMRIPTLSDDEMISCAKSRSAGMCLSDPELKALAESSGGNMKKFLLSSELGSVRSTLNKELDWESHVTALVSLIMKDRSSAGLLLARAKLYDLISHGIPSITITRTILERLLPHLQGKTIRNAIEIAALYEHRASKGTKAVFHLEAMVAKLMSIISTSA